MVKGVYRRMAHYAFELGQNRWAPKALTKKGEQVFGDLARTGGDPAGAGMGWMHRVYVAMNPMNQMLLQMSQSLVAASYSPRGFAAALRSHQPVLGAVAMRLAQLHGGKLIKGVSAQTLSQNSAELAKLAGMTTKEFNQVVEAIVSRGLIDSVAHNTAIKDAIGEAASRSMRKRTSGQTIVGGALRQADQYTFGMASRFGFQLGEDMNQVLTFLTLYAKDKAKGAARLESSAYLDDLIGRTAHITGNMVKEASPAYTRSLIKPLFQWVQFQHKMVMMTMPRSLGGSRMLTGAEKARMALTQFLLFGTRATAISYVVHSAIEKTIVERLESAPEGSASGFVQWWRDPVTKQVFDGLVFDYTANKVMQAIYGKANKDWSDFEWSKEFAPGSGQEFLAERLLAIFGRDRENFFGAQGEYVSSMLDYGRTISNVAQAQLAGTDDVDFGERARKLTQQGLSTSLPIYGRWLTAKWVQEHDAYISSGGQLGEGFSNDLEAKMFFALGLNTKERNSYYEAMDKLEGQWATEDGEAAEVQALADTYWRNLVTYGVKLEREAPTDAIYDQLLTEHVRNQGLLFSALGARNGERVNDIIVNKLENILENGGTPAEEQFVRRITSKLAKGEWGEKGPRAAVYLRNQEFVQSHPLYLQMVEDAFQEIVNEPMPQNMTEEQ
jgi:hypothetical protein